MDLVAVGEYDDPKKVDLVESNAACKETAVICVKIDKTGGKFTKHSFCKYKPQTFFDVFKSYSALKKSRF